MGQLQKLKVELCVRANIDLTEMLWTPLDAEDIAVGA